MSDGRVRRDGLLVRKDNKRARTAQGTRNEIHHCYLTNAFINDSSYMLSRLRTNCGVNHLRKNAPLKDSTVTILQNVIGQSRGEALCRVPEERGVG